MESVGVYFHLPFCERVCPYCDFAVVAAKVLARDLEERYVDALVRELALRRGAFAGRRLESVYFGGGTPSLFMPDSIGRLLAAVREVFPEAQGARGAEVTLEVNPSTVERARLPGFAAAGVNRVSLGIQSFDDRVLKRLGRAHRGEEGRATLRAAREAGFASLSLDLLYAAPGQDAECLARDLAEALAHAPEHVSAYTLTVEEGTPFARAAARGQLALPDEATSAALTEQIWDALEAAGLAWYELSSFARPGFEAVHNRRYWERRPVLGLGMGAWSSDPPAPDAPFGVRRANARSLEPYLEAVAAGRPAEGVAPERLGRETARFEAAFLALRTRAGLSAGAFEREFGLAPRAAWGDALGGLVAAGLLAESDAGDLRLTRRGRLLADEAFLALAPD